MNRLHECRDWT